MEATHYSEILDIDISSYTTLHSRRNDLNELNWLGIVVVTITETEVMISVATCCRCIIGPLQDKLAGIKQLYVKHTALMFLYCGIPHYKIMCKIKL